MRPSEKKWMRKELSEGDSLFTLTMSMAVKLAYRWLGPYRIHEALPEKGTYFLDELDGAVLTNTFAGNRLKEFPPRQRLTYTDSPESTAEEVRNDPRQFAIPDGWPLAVVVPPVPSVE